MNNYLLCMACNIFIGVAPFVDMLQRLPISLSYMAYHEQLHCIWGGVSLVGCIILYWALPSNW